MRQSPKAMKKPGTKGEKRGDANATVGFVGSLRLQPAGTVRYVWCWLGPWEDGKRNGPPVELDLILTIGGSRTRLN
jgi:hypothetical protein